MRYPISTHPYRVIGSLGLTSRFVSAHRTLEAAKRAARRDTKGATYGYCADVYEYEEINGEETRRVVYTSCDH